MAAMAIFAYGLPNSHNSAFLSLPVLESKVHQLLDLLARKYLTPSLENL